MSYYYLIFLYWLAGAVPSHYMLSLCPFCVENVYNNHISTGDGSCYQDESDRNSETAVQVCICYCKSDDKLTELTLSVELAVVITTDATETVRHQSIVCIHFCDEKRGQY